MKKLGVFPLPIFLLPGGVTQLRIFEPRYIRLVKESAGKDGFALAFYQKNMPFHCFPVASWVEIIDFVTLEDGLLGITIKAKALLELSNFITEQDGLLKADTSLVKHWTEETIAKQPKEMAQLSETLGDIINNNDVLKNLYPEPKLNDEHWVCARFIELLPLSFERKKNFIPQNSYEQCRSFLQTLIIGERNLQ